LLLGLWQTASQVTWWPNRPNWIRGDGARLYSMAGDSGRSRRSGSKSHGVFFFYNFYIVKSGFLSGFSIHCSGFLQKLIIRTMGDHVVKEFQERITTSEVNSAENLVAIGNWSGGIS